MGFNFCHFTKKWCAYNCFVMIYLQISNSISVLKETSKTSAFRDVIIK